MACKILGIACLVLLTFVSADLAQSKDSATSVYKVAVSLNDPPSANVEAEISIKDGRLFMIGGAVDNLPRGWATFVHDLKITDTTGKPLDVEEYSDEKYKTQWRLKSNLPTRVRLKYSVDYSFAKTQWPAGNEQAAYFDGKALYAASRTAIIISDMDASNDVFFAVPAGQKIAVPWQAKSANRFTATGEGLVNNTFVVGDFGGTTVRQGNFEFSLALLGDVRRSESLISATLTKFARYYGQLFPDTPRSRYMMTLFYADAEDGESYEQSAAFTTRPPINDKNLIVWGDTLGHELFHYWNGQQIRGAVYEDSQWFQEGFTEYYANLALMRTGILPEQYLIWKMERILGKYLYFRSAPQFSKVSLKDAGQKKTTYRFGVYDGGWAAAFALDMKIREDTNGRRSLDDLMRAMYEKYGKTGNKYGYGDVITTAADVSGKDLTDFFKRYVGGTETLPISDLLEKLGYASAGQDYADELLIYPAKNTALRSAWLDRVGR